MQRHGAEQAARLAEIAAEPDLAPFVCIRLRIHHLNDLRGMCKPVQGAVSSPEMLLTSLVHVNYFYPEIKWDHDHCYKA